jgi:hypothetical protein
LAALIDPMTMDTHWEVAVMDLDAAPALGAIARSERGMLDNVGEKPAVWTPMNAIFLQLEPQILATVAPANRQFAARWARKKYTLGGAFISSYLRAAAQTLETGTEFALAMDLEDVITPKRAEARIASGEFACLTNNKDVDLAAIAKLLPTLKGVTVRVEIADAATAKCTVDFGADAAALAPVAKPLFLEALARVGARLEDANGWNASIKRNTLAIEGPLSQAGLRELFSVIDPPRPTEVRETAAAKPAPSATPAAPAQPAPSPADAKAKACQQYFSTIDGILDRLGKNLGTGAKNVSLAEGAAWMQRDARRISRLPIKDVDPDLVRFGSEAATRLRDAAAPFVQGTLQAGARSAGISATVQDSYDYENTNELARVEGERRQAGLEQRARSLEAGSAVIRDLLISRDQIRAELVKRYSVEF